MALAAVLLWGALAAVADAHIGTAVSTRVALAGKRPIVTVWVDRAHVPPGIDDVARRVGLATRLTTGDGDCALAHRRDLSEDPWVVVVEMAFDCDAPPMRVGLATPSVLGAGWWQYVEMVLPHETRGSLHRGDATLAIRAFEDQGAWLIPAAIGLLVLGGLALVLRRSKGEDARRGRKG